MYQITIIPSEAPSYEELEESNTWLEGSLEEARQRQEKAERMAMMCLVLFGVTAVLLVLTWGGLIVI